MADTPTISSVTTFVAEIQGSSVLEILNDKFQGRRSSNTLAAARRMAAKKNTVKVPGNLMRQLWRITGGWNSNTLFSGWKNLAPDTTWHQIKMGDLVVIFQHTPYEDSRQAVLLYRGKKAGCITHERNSRPWLDSSKVTESIKALGQQYTP